MHSKRMIRPLFWPLTVIMMAGLTGCAGGVPTTLPTTAPSAPAAPAVAAGDQAAPPAATIDGRTLPLARIHELLVQAHGNEALQQLIASEVVEQAGRREGVVLAPRDIADENAQTLRALAPDLTPDRQEQIIEGILKDRRMPRVYWDMTMRRNAILRKLALARVQVTEPMLQEAFNRQYGQKVVIRHIQVASTADAQKILDLLAKGGDFAELARQFSVNSRTAENGGLLPAFPRDSPDVPPVMARAAFALQDGQASEILQADRFFHVIRRESTVAPKEGKFEELRQVLREQVLAEAVQRAQMQLLGTLISDADVAIVDPELRRQAAREQIGAETAPSR